MPPHGSRRSSEIHWRRTTSASSRSPQVCRPSSMGFVTYDNLFWPGGAPPTASDFDGLAASWISTGSCSASAMGRSWICSAMASATGLAEWPCFGVVVATAADPLDYRVAGGVAASTPEPSTWAMMILGFAGLGFAGYRKSRKAAASPPERSDPTERKAASRGGFFVGARRRRARPSGAAPRAPSRSATPKASTASAAANSNPLATSARREFSPAASRIAVDLAKTATQASAPVATAVPIAMAKAAATPAANSPCAIANTSTRIAPEHGRAPAAITVPAAARHEKGPLSSSRIGHVHVPAIVRQFAQRVGRPGAIGRRRKAEGRPLPCDASIGRSGSQCAAALRVLAERRNER